MHKTWKVGELARLSGLTVRTLHHYDEIGVLRPSERTPSGHRHYTEADARRLYQVVAMRGMGLSLEEVMRHLDGQGPDPRDTVLAHLARVERQLVRHQQLRDRLVSLLERLDLLGETSTPAFLDAIQGVAMMEQYFTPEQLEELRSRREQAGEEEVGAVEAEWPQLIAQVQAEMDAGTDPADPRVQALTRRWQQLLESFHGGNEELAAANRRMWQDNSDTIRERYGGPSPDMIAYIARAEGCLGPGRP